MKLVNIYAVVASAIVVLSAVATVSFKLGQSVPLHH
jgi:hypothetical protein